jgi:hypothetical protein
MGMETDLDEITAIETYQASVLARDAAAMEGRPLPEIDELPDGHKDPERLKAAQRDLDRLQTMRRAMRAHEAFAAVYSLGEFKQTRVLRRSPSADDVTHLDTSIEQPAKVEITLCVGGNRDIKLTVSEKTTKDELRRTVSTHQGGRCMVEPDQFTLRNGTEVRVIPVFIPQISEDAHMDVVVRCVRFREHFRPVATLPDVPNGFLKALEESHMGQPCQASVQHRPIRTGDAILMITAGDAQVKQEIQLQTLREEDKMPPVPTTSKAPPTMRKILNQAPPRAHSREIQLPWEIAKPELAARERVLVTLDLQNAIQEPAQRKVFLMRVRDDSWKKTSERAFGFPIKFDTEVQRVEEGNVIPCLVDFEEDVPKWPKAGTVHVSPRIPISFPIAIKVIFNDQTTNITIQNNTPASKVEEMLSISWGVQVRFAPNQ